jgi:hypothetical protein
MYLQILFTPNLSENENEPYVQITPNQVSCQLFQWFSIQFFFLHCFLAELESCTSDPRMTFSL